MFSRNGGRVIQVKLESDNVYNVDFMHREDSQDRDELYTNIAEINFILLTIF